MASLGRDFLALSRQFLDVLGADGIGSESDQLHFAVDGVEPAWVLLPASLGEVEAALRLCSENDLAVVPAGAGARLGEGLPPERVDVVLSTSRMEKIVDHAAADLTLVVEAGATLAAVNEALRPLGQWLPFDPPLPAETTIGGLVATRASGPSRQAFGTVRESLLGVRAVLADGTTVKSGGRVVKNVAGYDLHKLLVGSFGTLAVIVEAAFKLQPLPAARRTIAFCSVSLEALCRLAAALAGSVLAPQFLEVRADGESGPLLVVGFAGVEEEMVDASSRASSMASRFAIEMEESSEGGQDSQDSEGSETGFDRRAAGAIMLRGGTRLDRFGKWLTLAFEESRRSARRVLVRAHAGIGVARVRLDEPDRDQAGDLVRRLRIAALEAGGYVVIERAPADLKQGLDVWGPPPPGFDLMKGVKRAFDPRRLLSPGRFIGGL